MEIAESNFLVLHVLVEDSWHIQQAESWWVLLPWPTRTLGLRGREDFGSSAGHLAWSNFSFQILVVSCVHHKGTLVRDAI